MLRQLRLLVVLAGCVGTPADDRSDDGKQDGTCTAKTLVFSADELPAVPAADSRKVWGGNATQGNVVIDPPYDDEFLDAAHMARDRGLEVFGYLEGPCGDTGGVDDGERARCRDLHRAYNAAHAPATPDTDAARWKPYTFAQLTQSGSHAVDYCEIDNLSNNVVVPLIPLIAEIQASYRAGLHHCKLVFKNLSAGEIDEIRDQLAPTIEDAGFIAPFHIFEAEDTSEKPALDEAMRRLVGPGAVTIISLDTNHYGAAFTPDSFTTCAP